MRWLGSSAGYHSVVHRGLRSLTDRETRVRREWRRQVQARLHRSHPRRPARAGVRSQSTPARRDVPVDKAEVAENEIKSESERGKKNNEKDDKPILSRAGRIRLKGLT